MAKKRTTPEADALANSTFSEARDRLEAILTELESNAVDVDDLASRVKEAAALIRVLNDKLTRTKVEVEKVLEDVREDDGERTAAPDGDLRPERGTAGTEPGAIPF